MFGAWKPSAAKTFSRIMLEALQTVAYRESCRALFVVDTSTLKDPSTTMKPILDQGLRWPSVQWVHDADRRSRSGRTGTGCVAGDARNHHGAEVASFARVAKNHNYHRNDRRISGNFQRWDQCTQVYRPNRLTGRDPGVRTVGLREISGRSAVHLVIRARARSTDNCFTG